MCRTRKEQKGVGVCERDFYNRSKVVPTQLKGGREQMTLGKSVPYFACAILCRGGGGGCGLELENEMIFSIRAKQLGFFLFLLSVFFSFFTLAGFNFCFFS